jgi:NDP-sugar pyrophosphorylase family protein
MPGNADDDNTFVGPFSGANNAGTGNAFFGNFAGNANTTGSLNTFLGYLVGSNNTQGGNNIFVGSGSILNTTGSNNTFIGRAAGMSNTVGNNNTAIGVNANFGANNLSNANAIGSGAIVSQSNALVLGNNVNVGIGTSTPKAKLDVTGGNILVGSPGQGIILKSPDGATCKLLSIDNTGAMVLAPATCP